MEALDIEELNFDEYNREVYFEDNKNDYKSSKLFNQSSAIDAQKRYKMEIEKFVHKHKSGLANNEFDEANLGRIKKRKL